jgi:hypothetical protein
MSWWPPHQCYETSRTTQKTPGLRMIHTRHFLFGFLIYDRTYLVRSDNGFRVRVSSSFTAKEGS